MGACSCRDGSQNRGPCSAAGCPPHLRRQKGDTHTHGWGVPSESGAAQPLRCAWTLLDKATGLNHFQRTQGSGTVQAECQGTSANNLSLILEHRSTQVHSTAACAFSISELKSMCDHLHVTKPKITAVTSDTLSCSYKRHTEICPTVMTGHGTEDFASSQFFFSFFFIFFFLIQQGSRPRMLTAEWRPLL